MTCAEFAAVTETPTIRETTTKRRMTTPIKEFHMCVLGCSPVGKTSLLQRLTSGVAFSRKTSSKPSMEAEAVKYSVEVPTSAGLVLFHFYDWAWEQKRKDENINQQLMRGSQGAWFLFDVTDRRSLTDFTDYADWYQRAAGFEKPWVIVSNKNDQKKRAIQDGEGPALARKADHRAYVSLNLVEDTGVDELLATTAKLMMKDVNLTLAGPFACASAASLAWSEERAAAATAGLGLGMPVTKTKRVLLVVLNRSVAEKFNEMLLPTEYVLETVGSVDMCEEEFATAAANEGTAPLPVHAIVVPPTATESQKTGLTLLAEKYHVGFVVTVPRNLVEAMDAIGKK
jgi:GTP-binding protein EngB required for normal cell division